MIDIDELQLWTIVSVLRSEGDERIHIGSARRDGHLVVLHERNDGFECCEERVCIVPLASVIDLQILPDAETLRRAIEEDGIGLTDGKTKIAYSPEVG